MNMSDFPADLPCEEPERAVVPRVGHSSSMSTKWSMLAAKERTEMVYHFARLIFAGNDYHKAFVLSGLHGMGEWATEQTGRDAAAVWAAKPEVQAILDDLRAKTNKVIEQQAVYDTQMALGEAQMAFNMGLARGDAKAMVQAVFLKCKVTGLLVEDRKNERTPLKDLTDDELHALQDRLRADLDALEGVSTRVAE